MCWEENKTEITQFGHSIKWLFIVKIISSYKRTGNKYLFPSKGKGKNTPCVTLGSTDNVPKMEGVGWQGKKLALHRSLSDALMPKY